jgi:hypothetical protein
MDRPEHGALSAFVVILFLATSPARATSIDFDSPGDLTQNFNLNCNSPPPDYIEVSSGGIANSGAVGFGPTIRDTTAVYTGEPFSFLGGNILTVSEFAKFTPYRAGEKLLQVGFTGDETWQFRGGGYDDAQIRYFTSVRVLYQGGNDVYFGAQHRWGVASEMGTWVWVHVPSGDLATRQLIPDHWYKLTGYFQEDPTLDSDRIRATGVLEDWADGSAYTSTVYQWSINFPQANPIANDPSIYAAFRSTEGGTMMLDNFYADVIPEPLTAAALFIACGCLASYVRRRAGVKERSR